MKTILRSDFEALARVEGTCVSLYFPLQPTGLQGEGDSLRLKKAIEQAEEQLLARGCSKDDVGKLMASARDLPTSDQWAKRGRSMAILLGPGTQQCLPLTIDVAEEAWCDKYFRVRPLLPMVIESDRFYLLALSRNHVQLYEGNADELIPLQLKDMPRNMEDAVQAEVAERATRTHSAAMGGGGQRSTTFHGQGGLPDSVKGEVSEFVALVARVVDSHLEGQTLPLVLATLDEVAAQWRRASNYSNTLEEIVGGTPDYQSPHELYEAAWGVVTRSFEQSRQESFRQACNPRGSGTVLKILDEVLPAAIAGRIETLFVDPRRPVYGEFDRESSRVEVYPPEIKGDSDLLELAIHETIGHRGRVYAMPQAELEAADTAHPRETRANLVLGTVRY